MNEENRDISSLIDVSEFTPARHNRIDHSGFKDFQRRMELLQGKMVKKTSREARRENLKKWVNSLPSRWSKASLKSIDRNPDQAKEALKKISEGNYSFYVTGGSSSGKTYFCYAIIRRLIANGVVTPSEVRIISEAEILSYANNGFTGQDNFNKLLKENKRLFFIDHMGTKERYDERRELPMMSALIDHIYSNSHYLIVTSNVPPRKLSKNFGMSTMSRFEDLVQNGLISLKGSLDYDDKSDFDDDLEEYEKWN